MGSDWLLSPLMIAYPSSGFADFTETNTRLAIGKDANKAAARRLRSDMVDAIEERSVILPKLSHPTSIESS
jgi:hypothetical protein